MSDETNVNTENAEGAETATVENGTDWKAMARKWEAQSKANHAKLQELEPLAKKAQELEDAAKSDLEKDRKSTRLNSSHGAKSRMPSSA